jgi:uncharacterized membrane protein YbhN (UPF0104 family)
MTWQRARHAVGLLVLAVLVWRFGTGPFADAWRLTSWWSMLAALALTLAATVANAWRWRVVSRALGAPLTVSGSLTSYYRSQFLNAVLPGGVLGDAHRGVRHGRAVGDLGVGLRATVWDRATGQAVQVALLAVALLTLPTPLRGYARVTLAAVAAAGLVVWALAGHRRHTSFVVRDLRTLLRPSVAGRVALASAASTGCHVGVFLVATSTAGVHAGPAELLTLALVVLVGSAIPLNVAGWGPREGVSAGAFALVGLGSATGLTVSVVLGVLGAVATLPGLTVLVADAVVHRREATSPLPDSPALEEARHG